MLVHYKSELISAITKGWNKDGVEQVQDYDSHNQQPTLEEMLFIWMVVPDCLTRCEVSDLSSVTGPLVSIGYLHFLAQDLIHLQLAWNSLCRQESLSTPDLSFNLLSLEITGLYYYPWFLLCGESSLYFVRAREAPAPSLSSILTDSNGYATSIFW